MTTFELNGQSVTSESEPDTPLLWVIRDELKLKGTKFGCGIAMCGACTVHIDGSATRSCVTNVGDVSGRAVTKAVVPPDTLIPTIVESVVTIKRSSTLAMGLTTRPARSTNQRPLPSALLSTLIMGLSNPDSRAMPSPTTATA